MPAQPPHAAASKIAQLLGDVITHHAPWTADVSERARRAVTDEWLDRLEDYSAEHMGPIVDMILDGTNPPAPIAAWLSEVKRPSAALGGIAMQIFVYGLAQQIAGAALTPFLQGMTNDAWAAAVKAGQARPLSPADIATAVVRGIGQGDSSGVTIPAWAPEVAAQSGMSPDAFATLVGTSGLAPALQLLFEMIRRGIVDEAQLTEGIKESDIKDKWIPFVSKLRYVQPSATDFVAAAVRNQMPYDEANQWAIAVGLEPPGWIADNPDWFRILYDSAGRPPGVVELLELANRGLIPFEGTGPEVLSVQQAVAESDIKDKWFPAIQELAVHYPTAGEVRTFLMHGWIDRSTAEGYLKKLGIPADIVTATLDMAATEQTTQDRALAKGDIETLILDQIIDDDQAKSLLMRIGYTDGNADNIIALAKDRYFLEVLRTAARNVGQLYVKHKITAVEAKTGLEALGLPATNVAHLMDVLTAQRSSEIVIPTAGQITSAAYYQIIDIPTALSRLVQLGYGEWDAWLVLSARLHTPAGAEPPRPSTLS